MIAPAFEALFYAMKQRNARSVAQRLNVGTVA